ncbi:hypothetical protein HCA69_08305 [Listeria grandensis]|uniref:Bacterial Ig domain-containing protein n=1 Tax=Listeria grandensis TaxID=1494963 RepID=A0A7X0Y4C2_9LIST|nr:Ig-like domain-containing protein [Listeria grandensis]MBC1936364.1 hypothetical protein [Listeria grandensis]
MKQIMKIIVTITALSAILCPPFYTNTQANAATTQPANLKIDPLTTNTTHITGWASPGVFLTIKTDKGYTGSFNVPWDGDFYWQLPGRLQEGSWVHFSGSDGSTADIQVTEGTILPPTVDNKIITNLTQKIHGEGTPGATVSVYNESNQLGSAVVGSDGNYTLQLSKPASTENPPFNYLLTFTQSIGNEVSSGFVRLVEKFPAISVSNFDPKNHTITITSLPGYSMLIVVGGHSDTHMFSLNKDGKYIYQSDELIGENTAVYLTLLDEFSNSLAIYRNFIGGSN